MFFELPASVVDQIDTLSRGEPRSMFVSDLLERELGSRMQHLAPGSELSASMASKGPAGSVLSLVDGRGVSLGRFDIDSVEGFSSLAEKVCELSNDPIVRMKARAMR